MSSQDEEMRQRLERKRHLFGYDEGDKPSFYYSSPSTVNIERHASEVGNGLVKRKASAERDSDGRKSKLVKQSSYPVQEEEDAVEALLKYSDSPTKEEETSSKKKDATQEVRAKSVYMQGRWNSEHWEGYWVDPNIPDAKAQFKYAPSAVDEVDENMLGEECLVCEGQDPENFYFCDLCDGGYHTRCLGLPDPDPDLDWHCPTCEKILKVYGEKQLPRSRRWAGWFRMPDQHALAGSLTTESFRLRFSYHIDPTNNILADMVGHGKNKFGHFKMVGALVTHDGKTLGMHCFKTYMEKPDEKKAPKQPLKLSNLKEPGKGIAGTPVPKSNGIKPNPLPVKVNKNVPKIKSSSNSSSSSSSSSSSFSMTVAKAPTGYSKAAVSPKASPTRTQLEAKIASLQRELMMQFQGQELLVVTDMSCYFHKLFGSEADCRENQARLVTAWAAMNGSDLAGNTIWISDPPKAPLDAVMKAHATEYLLKLMANASRNEDDDLQLAAAMKGSGAVCAAIHNIVKNAPANPHMNYPMRAQATARNAIVLIRPPGHKVGRNGPQFFQDSQGASVLNAAAIGTLFAAHQLNNRVALLDLSLLPGEGCEEILTANYASTRKTNIFYGSVQVNTEPHYEAVAPRFNFPHKHVEILPLRSSPEQWQASTRKVFRALAKFQPNLVLLMPSFDGTKDNGSTGEVAHLLPLHYDGVTREIMDICPRIVSIIDGTATSLSVKKALKHHAACLMSP